MCGSDRQIMSLDSRRKKEIGRGLWTKQREREGLWTGEEPQCNKQGEFIAVGNRAHNLYSSCSHQNQIWDVTNFISKFIPECGHVPLIPTFFSSRFCYYYICKWKIMCQSTKWTKSFLSWCEIINMFENNTSCWLFINNLRSPHSLDEAALLNRETEKIHNVVASGPEIKIVVWLNASWL